MSVLKLVSLGEAEGKARDLLTIVKKTMGAEINLMSAMANAPEVLEAYLNFNGALSQGVLEPKLREQLALVTAGYNSCDYCASAHTFLGKKAGVSEAELADNLRGKSNDSKTQVALGFALKLLERRGKVTETDINIVRNAGFSDQEVVEILGHVSLNTFTNYFNSAFDTEIDFPHISTSK